MKYFISTFLLLSFSNVFSQLESPQWEIALFFEDSSGQKDTLIMGYDELAVFENGPDTLFEKFYKYEKDSFTMAFDYPNISGYTYQVEYDSVYEKSITSKYEIWNFITFLNANFPVVMKWDNIKLFSDSAPFPINEPKPNAKIVISEGTILPKIPCGFDARYTLTTDTNYHGGANECVNIGDSVVLDYLGAPGSPGKEEYLVLNIIRFNLDPFAIGIPKNVEQNFTIYPNPTQNNLFIQLKNMQAYTFQIRGLDGKIIKEIKLNNRDELYNLDVSFLTPGAYIISVLTKEAISNKILMKI